MLSENTDKDLQSNRTHILFEDMGPFFITLQFFPCRLMTTTEESTSTMPVIFSMDALSWKTKIPRSAATTGSMVAVTDAFDAGRPLSPFV